MQLLHNTRTKLELALVLIERWSPKACGYLSHGVDAEKAYLFVNEPAALAGAQGESGLVQHLRDAFRVREGVGIHHGGWIRDGWRRLGEGVGICLEQHLHDVCHVREGVGTRHGSRIRDGRRRVGEGVGIYLGGSDP